MINAWTFARDLIVQAAAIYDDRSTGLAQESSCAWRGGFETGAIWMRKVHEQLRREPLPQTDWSYTRMGWIKYGLACLASGIPVCVAIVFRRVELVLLAIPAFYLVEVQMVFLFPLALDGSERPFRDSLRWTSLAGGTMACMGVTMILAATMLFGGFFGRGFIRSWCLGCAAVCVWYERLRASDGHCGAMPPRGKAGVVPP